MKLLRWFVVFVLGLGLSWVGSVAHPVVERLYSRGLFPMVASGLDQIGGGIGISLAQIIVPAAVLLLVVILVSGIFASLRLRSWNKGIGPVHRWVAFLALVVWAFQLLWGLNYARTPLIERTPYAPVASDAGKLSRLVRLLAGEVNEAYRLARSGDQISRDAGADPAASSLLIDRRTVADRIAAAYREVAPFAVDCSSPKFPEPAGWVLSRLGISGFYFPLTGEANVNGRLPDAAIPAVLAHEMAHQRGTAREEEANFLAFLACRESGLAAAQYSGALAAFRLSLNALAQAAPDSAKVLAGLIDHGPREDRAAIQTFWRRHEGRASHVATRVNDAYLKTNAQRAGVASYGLAVDLLLAWMEAEEAVPGRAR